MTTSTVPQPKTLSTASAAGKACFRVTVPANLYFDVVAPEGTPEEEVRRLAVEQLISLRAQDGLDVIDTYAMRAYPKDDFTVTDITVEWGEELESATREGARKD